MVFGPVSVQKVLLLVTHHHVPPLSTLSDLATRKVLQKYNCQYLRKAAINVTRITTRQEPHVKQPIYGARALDFVFDMGNDKFDLASFFGEEIPMRISTLATPAMIRTRLISLFGNDEQFTEERATTMIEVMLEDLRNNR